MTVLAAMVFWVIVTQVRTVMFMFDSLFNSFVCLFICLVMTVMTACAKKLFL